MMSSNTLLFAKLCLVGLLLVSCATKQAVLQDEQELAAFLGIKKDEVSECFQGRELPAKHQERLRLKAIQSIQGDFSQVELLEGDEKIGRCVANKVEGWRGPAPRITGPVELSWEFDHETKTEILAQDLSSFQSDFDSCFGQARARQPDLMGGLMRLQIRIDARGRVEDMEEITGFRGSEPIVACVSRRAQAWQFSKKQSPSTQVWTWNFKNQIN